MRPAILLLLCAMLTTVTAYLYPCLDKCDCDTTDEVIHCHNGERTTLALPESGRLRGFHAIGMTFNNIKRLPSEDEITDKFPDVLAIDVERNAEFDCASVLEYTRVKIISDCYKNISDISQIPDIHRPTRVGIVWLNQTIECDLACQAKKHYDELHKYVVQLWEVIKEKYRTFDSDDALEQIKTFFIETVQSINTKINKELDEFHPRNQKKIAVVSPAPELQGIDLD